LLDISPHIRVGERQQERWVGKDKENLGVEKFPLQPARDK